MTRNPFARLGPAAAVLAAVFLSGCSQAVMRPSAEQSFAKPAADASPVSAFREALAHPLNPTIDASSHVLGSPSAPLTLVEYSDFQCSYCAKAVPTVQALRAQYGSSLRFVFKPVALSMHPQALLAAKYFEAVSLQSPEKAWQFYDSLFANQDKFSEDFFRTTAQGLDLDMGRLERDLNGPAVQARLSADQNEFRNFGFTGTPSFLLNGAPIVGAWPLPYFEKMFAIVSGAPPPVAHPVAPPSSPTAPPPAKPWWQQQ